MWTMSDAMQAQQEDVERKALKRAVATVNEDNDSETLVEGIPGYPTGWNQQERAFDNAGLT